MAERVARTMRAYRGRAIAGLILSLIFSCLASLLAAHVAAAEPTPAAGINTKAAREEATNAIPWKSLDRNTQAAVQDVIANTSIYRRLPPQTIDCEPDLFLNLLKNPELVVNMWTTLGVTKMSMDRLGPGNYRLSDGEGTSGHARVLASSDAMHLIISDGSYTGSMYPRPIKGRCVLLLRHDFAQDQRGRVLITCNLDMFLTIDNFGVEVLAKTFQSTVGKATDHNFAETTSFVSKLSKTSETNPEGVVRLTQKLQNVDPPVKAEFCVLAEAVNEKLTLAKRAYMQRAAMTPTVNTSAPGRQQPAPRPIAPASASGVRR
jgi:hypothetical protein